MVAQSYEVLVNESEIISDNLPEIKLPANNKLKDDQPTDTLQEGTLKPALTYFWKSLCGLICGFASCIFFATGSMLAKLCDGSLDANQIVIVRSAVQLFLTIPIIRFYKLHFWQPFSRTIRVMLILRGIFGGCSLILVYYSFQILPLGDASAIVFSAAIYTLILARIFLKEKFVCLDVIVLVATVVGVVLIAKPSFLFSQHTDSNLFSKVNLTAESGTNSTQIAQNLEKNSLAGLAAAFAASLLVACVHITLRKLPPTLHYTIPLFYFSVAGIIAASLVLVVQQTFLLPTDAKFWGYAISVGICGFFGQFFLTKALQMEKAGHIGIVRQCDIVLGYVFQVVVFHEPLELLSVIGTTLIIAGSLVLAFKKLALATGLTKEKFGSCCICKEI